jgi:hypothetical protein
MSQYKFSKNIFLYSLLLLLMAWILPAHSQPTVLELKVLQTRVFDVTPEKFLSGAQEMCRNYGGLAIGLDSPIYLPSGISVCMSMKEKFKHIQKLTFQGQKENNLGLAIRMRIESYSGPSYDKKHYDDVAKEIADTIGVQDIPIRLDPIK